MSEDLRAGVIKSFGDELDEKLIEECMNMCRIFALSPQDLFFKWEAMNFNARSRDSGLKITFTMDSAAHLKQQMQRDLQSEAAKAKIAQGRANLSGMMSKGKGAAFLNVGSRRTAGMAGQPVVKTEPGTRVPGFGGASSVAGPSKVRYVGPDTDEESRKKRSYRYMYEKVMERGNVLDSRIDDFAELIQVHYNVQELGDPATPTDEDVIVVGRIILDPESASTGSAKLNEASLMLESSRLMGSGARVPLRFEPNLKVRGFAKGAGGVGLFPGAIVTLRGRNGGGGWFSVSEILANPPLPSSSSSRAKTDSGDDAFSMFIASGPFTPDADLKYKPFRSLVDTMKSTKPAVVLLIGPFIDLSHPRIKDGEIDEIPAQLFSRVFTEPLKDFLDSSPGSIVLLVPSVRDLISDHAVHPQAEFSSQFIRDSRMRLLPNPCRFSINGLSFGTTSVDVLFHLRKEEYVKRCAAEVDPVGESETSDAMANLCRHLVAQRSFYPIFPTPLDVAHDVNLDLSHSAGLDITGSAPEVFIVPSRLKHFSKTLDEAGVTAINPAFLSKGMYATLAFDGRTQGPAGVKVEIVKLPESGSSA